MSAPLVSVIMPAHNAAPFIGDAIRSVLAQTHRDLELLIVDDASTDGTGGVIAVFDDARLRRFHSKVPLNAAGARNLALAEARGEFIAFLDADDIAARDRIARQLAVLHAHPEAGIVASLITPIDAHSHRCGPGFVKRRDSAEIPPTLLFENCIALSSVTARCAVLKPFRPALTPAEDYAMWAQLAHETQFVILPQRLTAYRTHAGGVSVLQPAQMQSAVATIHAEQLARLGVVAAPAIHARIAAWPLDSTLDQLAEAGDWLLRLRATNDERGTFPRTVFARVLAGRWFSICLDSWPLGWPVWTLYHRSPLAAPTLVQHARLLRRLLPQRFRRR